MSLNVVRGKGGQDCLRFFHTSSIITTGYSKNKMGSTTSELCKGQFLRKLKVRHYDAENCPKITTNGQKQCKKGIFSKFQNATPLHHFNQFLSHLARN